MSAADPYGYGPQNAAEREAADAMCREAVIAAVLSVQTSLRGRRLNRRQRELETRAARLARWAVTEQAKRGTP